MRVQWIGRALLVTAAVLGAGTARGQEYVPADPPLWTPLYHDRPETGGFFAAMEFVFYNQTRHIDRQVIAFRGFFDSNGTIPRPDGSPAQAGTFFGSGAPALTTDQLGRGTFQPGFSITLGWRTSDGVTFYGNYKHFTDAKYSGSASLVPPFFQGGPRLADTFITAPVFNFPTLYAGPDELSNPPGPLSLNNAYGIWNAATNMDILFTQRYKETNFGARIPLSMCDTEFSRSYLIAGGKFSWIWERFRWRTEKDGFFAPEPRFVLIPNAPVIDPATGGIVIVTVPVINPNTGLVVGFTTDIARAPQFVLDPNSTFPSRSIQAATYSNVVSNRMYGPELGCGTDFYLGNRFAVSLDTSAALLIDVVKTRAKYELRDAFVETQAKRAQTRYEFSPYLGANLNLWWYPIEGVQVRFGYNAMGFFNTIGSRQPIGFNFGAIDPGYQTIPVRFLHGFNTGIGFTF